MGSRAVGRIVLCVFALLALCFGGGLLNRIRGGWISIAVNEGGNVFTHDGVYRGIWAASQSVLLFVCLVVAFYVQKKDKMILKDHRHKTRDYILGYMFACLLFGIVTYFSLFIGWGTYFHIGRSTAQGRAGVFD